MNTSANNPNVVAKTLVVALVVSVVGFLSMASRVTSSSAAFQERILENGVREHVPIKLKIKKEKEDSFKDLKNEKWAREFELEVTNTGDKPIYYVYLDLVTDVKMAGMPLIFSLQYGRSGLGDLVSKARPEDVAIKPKETYVFKLHEGQIPAWEESIIKGRHPDATKLRVLLYGLSFGDGTGYFGNTPYPPASKQQPNQEVKKAKGKSTNKARGRSPSFESKGSFTIQKPAKFSPVNFLSAEASNPLSLASAAPQTNCQFSECASVIVGEPQHVCYNCPLQNRPSGSSIGVCKELIYGTRECTAGTETFICQTIAIADCGFGPGPTPTPTPTPSPQPCNYCTDPNSRGPADCSNPSQPKCDALGLQFQQNGCCYDKTCDLAGINPPPPLPCPPGEVRSSNLLQPFPDCTYKPCLPIPPIACVDCSSNGDCCNGDVCHSGLCGPPQLQCGQGCPPDMVCVEEMCSFATPILIDVDGDGFNMTNTVGGVDFDFNGDGGRQRLPWTAAGSDDAWLVLDLNRNGLIDNGREMFGNLSNQPRVPPTDRNGFLALAEYDKFGRGGNGDGVISSNDFIFRFLKLWTDANHNGISEAAELRSLDQSRIDVLELEYRLSSRTDQHGNQFRYRAKVKSANGAQLGRWSWDVIFNGRGR